MNFLESLLGWLGILAVPSLILNVLFWFDKKKIDSKNFQKEHALKNLELVEMWSRHNKGQTQLSNRIVDAHKRRDVDLELSLRDEYQELAQRNKYEFDRLSTELKYLAEQSNVPFSGYSAKINQSILKKISSFLHF